ncbi:16S rRNA (cytosine(1402)-N(4))-methyltransferase RsmH [Mycoplasma sp. HU2014]|uniref:16S rRNA (cytosine(1402)-N(4))-methyltransferase RsmH n=1 Tax=Mycoplasma sp. HU2014 TaxID=1664275 RepID=UPI00067CE4A4|nr:16S rRNA (cytosine(1402)-N(4))-methyltransferase RsmH [Mycoplasma sp. HU2014]KNG79415.1 ribosomal RNA small subunit methyltransferase H [Mycoplasma sp. HU2014]
MQEHIPVLLKESIEYLNIKPDGVYVDCTLGRAGHSSEILKKLSDKGMLYCFDQDKQAIEKSEDKLKKIGNNFKIIESNFNNISMQLALNNVFSVDGILYDLGVSSPQFDIAERGFSYRFDGPLDMRMDRENNKLTADEIVNTYSENQIADILFRYGDELNARKIAKQIINSRPITSTLQLVEVIKKALSQKVLKQQKHPAKKSFQALRIYVNNELNALQDSITQALELLNSKARICVITFHSLEEKIVKNSFNSVTNYKQEQILSSLPINVESNSNYRLIVKKPIKPTNEELQNNKRSHSAKLWVIEKK